MLALIIVVSAITVKINVDNTKAALAEHAADDLLKFTSMTAAFVAQMAVHERADERRFDSITESTEKRFDTITESVSVISEDVKDILKENRQHQESGPSVIDVLDFIKKKMAKTPE